MAVAPLGKLGRTWTAIPMETSNAPDVFLAARGMQTATWIYDVDNCRVIHANAAAIELWNAESEDALRARDMANGMSPAVAKRLKQYKADFIDRDAVFCEQWTLYPNGVPKSVMVRFFGVRLPDMRMAMQCEVSGKVDQPPENLRSAEALLHTDVAISLYMPTGPALYMNPAARNQSHQANASLSQIFVHRKDFDILMYDLDGHGEHRRVAEIKTSAGHRWFDVSAKTCSDAVTGDAAILVTAFDVSELKLARDKARYLADRDQLTGCYNRFYLQHHIEEASSGDKDLSAMIYFDVDRFKQINDTFGHEVGDAVLIELASRARNQSLDEDAVVRLGGDEFVIAIRDATDDAILQDRIDGYFAALSEPVRSNATVINTRVSMGITVYRPGAADVETLLRQADTALYASKKAGRNRFTRYTDQMGADADYRSRIESEIERGLAKREFILYFQPRVSVKTGLMSSVEGLVRWAHPERGIVSPGEFIPICEETGMIETLGKQVLELGFAQAAAWQQAGVDTCLSLNISPRQFATSELINYLTEVATAPNFPRGKVELEITENVLFGDHDGVAAKLQTISDLGYQIAIDDFGTGYSNLAYISRFPLNCLKIDRSFIMQLPESGPVIRLIIALAQQIKVKTVAEGVETQAQFDWLVEHQCDEIQGFYLSRPLPIEELSAKKLAQGSFLPES